MSRLRNGRLGGQGTRSRIQAGHCALQNPELRVDQMNLEAGVVVGYEGEPIFWHLPEGRTAGYLPDSRELWEVIWENRHNVYGIAHSHPGSGLPGPSREDITTFAGIELGLGRRLVWWITSSNS